ncbi:alpha/beta fold hydrolase [Mycobacterium crocinum]|uniref:Alpha/beta hydrolase n=1 Tax=Mycolicibacterium crocinum TaxID=388459 RepID=A0ABY3TJ65_9MYCO|nr:alpha/beta hydrolase [Mycolicibacterium crocinum]MCV7216320.1 alpha/beta fold hydrolase [Mycolicibacterium crocinum]ULN41233.1 alpha/beta hydrolase [Mycolicibacterium crocinum]
MPTLLTRVGPVAYSDDGTGPVLVLLHAALHDRHDFDAIVPRLADGYRVIAVDWPGHGDSPAPSSTPSASLYADVLEDLVAALDLPPAVFIGSSVGGFAAGRLAITQPERVAGLVLVDTGGFLGGRLSNAYCRFLGTPAVMRRVLPRFVRSYLRAQSANDEAVLRRVTERACTPDGVAMTAALWRSFAAPESDLRERAAQINAPTLIVWGEHDTAIPLRFGRATQRTIAGSRLEVLATGHLPFSSQPQRFLGTLESFLRELQPLSPEGAGREPDSSSLSSSASRSSCERFDDSPMKT